jgi:hypothetical protein
MLLQCRAWLYGLALILGAALTAAPVRAGDVDKYLPDDTEVVVTLNVKQITDSPLFKKNGVDAVQQLIKDNEEVNDVLKDLGFDPLTDVDRIVISSPGGDENDKGLIIIHGRFDLDKFKARGEEAAKSNSEHLKIHKRETGPVIYEVAHPKLDNNLFVALVDKKTMLVSPGKDYVIDALKKTDAKQATLKNKDLKTQLEQTDAKQSVSVAMIGSAAAKSNVLTSIFPKETLANVDAVGGGFTVDDDIQMQLVVTAKNADSAKDVNEKINDNLNDAVLALALLIKAEQLKGLAPALDVVKSIKTITKDKTITVKGEVTAEQIEKLSKAIGDLLP